MLASPSPQRNEHLLVDEAHSMVIDSLGYYDMPMLLLLEDHRVGCRVAHIRQGYRPMPKMLLVGPNVASQYQY